MGVSRDPGSFPRTASPRSVTDTSSSRERQPQTPSSHRRGTFPPPPRATRACKPSGLSQRGLARGRLCCSGCGELALPPCPGAETTGGATLRYPQRATRSCCSPESGRGGSLRCGGGKRHGRTQMLLTPQSCCERLPVSLPIGLAWWSPVATAPACPWGSLVPCVTPSPGSTVSLCSSPSQGPGSTATAPLPQTCPRSSPELGA